VASYATNETCVEEQNAAAFNFNIKLKALVEQLNNGFSADSKFIFIDTQSLAIHLRDRHSNISLVFLFKEIYCL